MPEVFADRREGAVLYLVEGKPAGLVRYRARTRRPSSREPPSSSTRAGPNAIRAARARTSSSTRTRGPWSSRRTTSVFTSEQGTIVDPAAVAGWVQPRDGLWRAEVGPSEIDGCPPMMRSAFPTAAPLPGFSQEPRRLAFSRPFDPNALELSRTATGHVAARCGDAELRRRDGPGGLRADPAGRGRRPRAWHGVCGSRAPARSCSPGAWRSFCRTSPRRWWAWRAPAPSPERTAGSASAIEGPGAGFPSRRARRGG